MITTENIVQEFSHLWAQAKTLWVGFSGGLDSTVLLHLVEGVRRYPEFKHLEVKAIHVNHQLSNNADSWQVHCQKVCDDLNLPIVCENIHVISQGKGLESAAREGRYKIFEHHMAAGDILFGGHHRDDQAETFIYRLMRGSGLQGLTGIAKVREFSRGKMLRPILDITREEIQLYAQHHHLTWVDDESNIDLKYDRNYLRHKVLPVLHERWPNVQERVAMASSWLAEASDLLAEYAEQDLMQCDVMEVYQGESISLMLFNKLSCSRQKNVLRFWCKRLGMQTPDASRLSQFTDITNAREDAQPCLSFGDYELRRFKKRLYLVQSHSKTTAEYK